MVGFRGLPSPSGITASLVPVVKPSGAFGLRTVKGRQWVRVPYFQAFNLRGRQGTHEVCAAI